MANDSEKALDNSKKKYFQRCLHALCWLHLHENLSHNCLYKNSPKLRQELIDFIMITMCDCGSVQEFDILKLQVAVKWPRGFNGNYFDIFAANVREYVLKPRLAAPHSIPKAFKTNDIESSNARAKLYINHVPRNLYEAVYFMKKMGDDVKFNFIQALYGEGPLKISPNSNIKLIDKTAWEWMTPEKQESLFLQKLGIAKMISKDRREIKPPQMPDTYNLTVEETKQAKLAHQICVGDYNQKKNVERFEISQETGKPALNINNRVKTKPHQHGRPTANKTRKSFIHLAK